MRYYLEKYYEQTSSDDAASLLGETAFLADGSTADPAAWEDWMECVEKAFKEGDKRHLLILKK